MATTFANVVKNLASFDRIKPTIRMIDSHVHVWSDGTAPFPYINSPPPEDLREASSPQHLLRLMDASGVHGAIVIQPINYQYDHSYLTNLMQNPQYNRFKYMALLDPTMEESSGKIRLEELQSLGFKGIRYNPYLWSANERMSDDRGMAWFRKAGELNLVVGIMCFKGLSLHYDDIVKLLQEGNRNGNVAVETPTQVIIDHFGFFVQGGKVDEQAWNQLLSLAKYPEVYVKVSAFFRVSMESYPHCDLDPLVVKLVDTFGAQRLLFGTDFPFVQQQHQLSIDGDDGLQPKEPYIRYVEALQSWPLCQQRLSDTEWTDMLGGTAERLFGPFGEAVPAPFERPTEQPPPPGPGPVAAPQKARMSSGVSIISRIALLLVTFFHTIRANILPPSPRILNFWGPIPSLRLFQPHDRRAIDSFLREKESAPFNHPFAGLSQDCNDFHGSKVPSDYRQLNTSIVIGNGQRDLDRAIQALHSFEMVNALPWSKIVTKEGKTITQPQNTRLVAPGSTVCTLIRCYGVAWSLNPCRVIYSSPNQLAYATLQGHLIAGEERFRLHSTDNGDVIFSMYSFTKGAGVIGTIAMPFIRPIQRRFFRDVASSMRRIVQTNPSE